MALPAISKNNESNRDILVLIYKELKNISDNQEKQKDENLVKSLLLGTRTEPSETQQHHDH